jgi:hypothetical protein
MPAGLNWIKPRYFPLIPSMIDETFLFAATVTAWSQEGRCTETNSERRPMGRAMIESTYETYTDPHRRTAP